MWQLLILRELRLFDPDAQYQAFCLLLQFLQSSALLGKFKPDAISYFQQVIDHMKAQGCDAIILGCTEIPLIINDDNSPLPTLDFDFGCLREQR